MDYLFSSGALDLRSFMRDVTVFDCVGGPQTCLTADVLLTHWRSDMILASFLWPCASCVASTMWPKASLLQTCPCRDWGGKLELLLQLAVKLVLDGCTREPHSCYPRGPKVSWYHRCRYSCNVHLQGCNNQASTCNLQQIQLTKTPVCNDLGNCQRGKTPQGGKPQTMSPYMAQIVAAHRRRTRP